MKLTRKLATTGLVVAIVSGSLILSGCGSTSNGSASASSQVSSSSSSNVSGPGSTITFTKDHSIMKLTNDGLYYYKGNENLPVVSHTNSQFMIAQLDTLKRVKDNSSYRPIDTYCINIGIWMKDKGDQLTYGTINLKIAPGDQYIKTDNSGYKVKAMYNIQGEDTWNTVKPGEFMSSLVTIITSKYGDPVTIK